jgi:hypothetical protein
LVWNVPRDARLVWGAVVPARGGVLLIIHSETFPVVAEGEPIPDLEGKVVYG